jgi:hypothetical protein
VLVTETGAEILDAFPRDQIIALPFR